METKIPLIVVSSGLEKKDIGYLRMSLFNFEKVEISNFDRPAADILIDHFIHSRPENLALEGKDEKWPLSISLQEATGFSPWSFIKEFGIKINNETDFKKQIFHFSKGNPKIIKGLCFLARDVKYQKNDAIDVKLMDLDRRISEIVH